MKAIFVARAIFIALTVTLVGCTSKESRMHQEPAMGQKTSWEVSGIVARFITTPTGEVDGFILEDGMQIRFPSHMSTAITDSLAVGDSVIAKGYESTTSVMWATQIVTPKNAEEISVAQKAKGKLVPPKREAQKMHKNIDSMTVSGEIDTLLHEPTGEVSGFVLTEGSVVRLPMDIRSPAKAYDVGQYVEVTGYGTENKFGKSVEASTVQRQTSEYEIDYE